MKLHNLLLALLLVLSLLFVGCADNQSDTDKDETTDAVTTEQTGDITPNSYTPLLYRVTDSNQNTVWLFGSIHVGREGMEEFPDYVMSAYNSSEALAVECDIVTFQQDYGAMTSALTKLVYIDGTTIKDHLPEVVYDEAAKILKDNNQYVMGIDYYKPIMWSSTIDNLVVARSGLLSENGVDMNLLNRAHKEGKTILEVESAEFQYTMLGSFSPDLQLLLLNSSIASFKDESSDQALLDLLDAWCRGDAERMNELNAYNFEGATAAEQALLKEHKKAMLTDRDAAMTQFAVDCLNQGKEVFICVGAAHIVGEEGVAASLKALGYTVETIRG